MTFREDPVHLCGISRVNGLAPMVRFLLTVAITAASMLGPGLITQSLRKWSSTFLRPEDS
jgi:hypothetical protein